MNRAPAHLSSRSLAALVDKPGGAAAVPPRLFAQGGHAKKRGAGRGVGRGKRQERSRAWPWLRIHLPVR